MCTELLEKKHEFDSGFSEISGSLKMHCLHHRLPATTCEHYSVYTTDLSLVVTPDSHPTITNAPSVAQLASLLMSTVIGAFEVR